MAESRNLQALVGVRLTDDERARGNELATRQGTTLAALMRGMLRDLLDAKGGAPEDWGITLFDQRDAALEAVARVRKLHQRTHDDGAYYCGWSTGQVVVNGCGLAWPCPTIRALDGGVADASPSN